MVDTSVRMWILEHLSSIVAQTAGMLKGPEPRLSEQQEKVAAEEAIAEEVEKKG